MASLIEDRDEILQLLYKYNHAIDGGEAERWAGTFTESGVLDAAGRVFAGQQALVAFASGVHGMRHIVTNPVVEVTEDTATVRAYVVVFRGTSTSTIGTYADDLVRTPAGWRFAKRVFTPDSWDSAATETLRSLVGQSDGPSS
jgi:hypothetical protein